MSHRDSEQKAEAYIKLLQEAINSEDQDDDEVIDIASQVLNFMPDDKDVLLCRAVAYIKTSPPQFQDALVDLEKVPNSQFEKCLCLYGLRKFDEALKLIKSLKPDEQKEERYKMLEEQILLSMDDPVELKKFYANTDFSKASPSELKNMTCGLYITGDVENALKVLAKNPKPRKGSLYNLASLLVMTKNYEKATELIESGLKRCADSPMFLQLFQILKAEVTAVSNPEQAIEMYTNLLDNEKVHPYCAQIAASNFSALTLDSNVHLAKKKMSLYDNNEQYGSYRRSEIESYLINRFLILHKIGQPGKVKALIDFAKKQSKIDPLIPETFERTVDPSNSELTKYSVLFEAQNLISQSKFIEAADILASSPLNKAPRTITVVSELYVAAQQPQKAIEFLTKSDNGSAPFLDFAARFAYQIGFYEQGAKWAEKLVKATNNSQRAIAIHSLCLSMTDIEMAERYAQRIKIDSVSESELDALEETQISKESTASSNADSLQTVDDSLFSGEKKKGKKLMENMSPEKIKKLKEKKKKRRRLQKPANYDPQRHMDPERWIKLKKRTGAKKGGKKPAASASNTQNAAQQQQKKQQKKKGKRGKNVW